MKQGMWSVLVASLVVAGFGLVGANQAGEAAKPGPGSGIDRATFDPAVRPQDDLFRHVNGGWIAADRDPGRPAVYGVVRRTASTSAEADLRAIIEEAAAGRQPPGLRGSEGRRPLRQLHGRGAGRASSA